MSLFSTGLNSLFVPFVVTLIVFIIGFKVYKYSRKRARRRTLTYENGWYVWIAFDGSEQRSQKNPEEYGGDWYEESHSDGGGFGDGGFGGGDGGGGDGGGGGD